jgi:hypothetical protein
MRLLLLAGLILVAGCGAAPSSPQNARLNTAETKIATLEQEVKNLRDQLEVQTMSRNLREMAFLTPAEEGYSVLETDIGSMTVALQNIRPYATGSRVTLQFGNATAATMLRASVRIEWGSVDANARPDLLKSKSKKLEISKRLLSGAWTNVEVVLEGVPPTALGFVRITEFEQTSISLGRSIS